MESSHYFNTTSQDTEFVESRVEKNKSQEQIVYELFKSVKKMTASEVLEAYPGKVPLTSIRRAMSNLQYEGKIHKIKSTKTGLYGSPERYYLISKIEERQFDMFEN